MVNGTESSVGEISAKREAQHHYMQGYAKN
jgi:hypothetical protein